MSQAYQVTGELTDSRPKANDAWIRWYDALEPVEFSAAERAAWDAARQEQKQIELAQWHNRSQQIEEPALPAG